MLEEIGTTAGEIWHYLEKNDVASVAKLRQELKKTERMILLGIGWLAREGKIITIKRSQATYFMLDTAASSAT